MQAYPSWLPAEAKEIQEPAAQAVLQQMKRARVSVGAKSLDTAYTGPASADAFPAQAPAVVLLHGFDSSQMEFRRLIPLLAPHVPTYAPDLLGWGFTDVSAYSQDKDAVITPAGRGECTGAGCAGAALARMEA
jgi:pimeloyl-ACP methyl ester carboxylesterase